MGKDSYMDGFKYDVPAEKLGYIQKLGAGRMAPGKKGDLTAMKMMHGDAAAKYYDGAGMYMNGAPKYEGASKSYVGPMDAGHGGAEGHTHAGSDRPSYTQKNTNKVVVPGTSSSTDTSSSGGSTSSTSNYDKLMSTKKDLGPDFKPTAEQTAKANEEVRIAREKDKAESEAKKNSVKTSTKPSIKTEVKKEKKTSKNQGKKELLDAGKEKEENRRNRYQAGQEERVNLARRDSANVADKYLKGRPVNERNLMHAVKMGNKAGRRTLVSLDSNKDNSFGESNGEFRFTHGEAANMFSRDIGTGTANVTSGRGSKADTGDQINIGRSYSSFGGQYRPSQIGQEISIGKKRKGSAIVTGVNTDAGSAGSYGGFETPQEYLAGGSPKLPTGPMKFGMNSSKGSGSGKKGAAAGHKSRTKK